MASERRSWVPANWAMVGVSAVVGFTGGSVVTTVRGGWDETTGVTVPQVRGDERAEAVRALGDEGLSVTLSSEPSESIREGLATRTNPPGGATVDEDASVMLFMSTGPPGATVKIPEVTGLERAAARALLRDHGVRPRVREESSRRIAAGNATRTIPPAGTRVDRDSRIALLVSIGPPAAPVTIPDVRGQPRADALERLRGAGLRAATETEASEDIPADAATRTDPGAGTEVERGTTVTLFVSSGRATGQVEVPAVVGMAREEAQQTVEGAGLVAAFAEEPSSSVAAGLVTRSDPAAGTVVDEGATVTLLISSGPPPLVVPAVVGKPEGEARRLLRQVGLGAAYGEADSTQPAGTVVSSDPPPGTEVERGSSVRLNVSCGFDPCPEG
jgi:beta-lactam-binding protein with PASTA domain